MTLEALACPQSGALLTATDCATRITRGFLDFRSAEIDYDPNFSAAIAERRSHFPHRPVQLRESTRTTSTRVLMDLGGYAGAALAGDALETS